MADFDAEKADQSIWQKLDEINNSIKDAAKPGPNWPLLIPLYAAVFGAVITAVGAVVNSIYTNRHEAEQNRYQASQTLKLEVIKSALSAPDPWSAQNRLRFFAASFPGLIDANELIDPAEFGRRTTQASKLSLFEQLRAAGLPPDRLLLVWQALFPGDEWATTPELKAATQIAP